MASYGVHTITAPTAPGTVHITVTGSANREYLVTSLYLGKNSTSTSVGRLLVYRASTAPTGTARVPEKHSSRSPAFHGTVHQLTTANPTLAANPLLILHAGRSVDRHGKWTPPRSWAAIHSIDATERVAVNQALDATMRAGAFVVGLKDTLSDAPGRRTTRRARSSGGWFSWSVTCEWPGGSNTNPRRMFDQVVAHQVVPWWVSRSRLEPSRLALDGGGGPAPIDGGALAALGVTATVVGSKVADGDVRAATAVTARATAAKVATGTARAGAGVTARATGAKIAGAGARAVAGVVASITGAPVSTTVAGSARAVLGVVARATGSKVAPGAARAGAAVTARPTGAKVAAGAAWAVAAAVGRVTSAKVAGGAGRVLAGATARATGTKAAGGSARAGFTVSASAAAAKLATAGAARTAGAVVARVSSTPPGVVAGSARAAIAVVARVTGTKVAGGSARAGAGVTGRATAVKLAAGGTKALAAVVTRVTPLKRAGGAAVAVGSTVASAVGAKSVAGSARAAVAVIVRTPSRAPAEAWTWLLRRGGVLHPATARLDGVHPTSTDVT